MGKVPGLFTYDTDRIDPIYALEGVLSVQLQSLNVEAKVPDQFTYQVVLFGDDPEKFDAAQAIVTEHGAIFGLVVNRAHYEEDENLREIANIPSHSHLRILDMKRI